MEEGGDVVGVCLPAGLVLGDSRRVARPRRRDQVGGDQDVVAQEPRQLVARRVPVERLDGVADVDLVLEKPPDGRARVRASRSSG